MKRSMRILGVAAITAGIFFLSFGLSVQRQTAITADEEISRVIVQGNDLETVASAVESVGGTVVRELSIIRSVGAEVTPTQLAALQQMPEIKKVYDDRKVGLSGFIWDDYSQQVAMGNYTEGKRADTHFPKIVLADQLHQLGFTGRNVTVAVIDTGMAIEKNLNEDSDQSDRVVAGLSLINNKFDERYERRLGDNCGHGTHVTSIIAGSNTDTDGNFQGIAPDVRLAPVRAFDEDGKGTYLDAITAVDWIVQNKDVYNIRVLNCSFSAVPVSKYWDDPLNQAIMAAWKAGIVVVASAGNRGPDPLTIGVPGNVPYVITVGAMTDNFTDLISDDEFVCSFSSAGPSSEGFVKPEMVAPGGHILGIMSDTSSIYESYSAYRYQYTDDRNRTTEDEYFYMSGTSQAAAVVSGIVALMLDRDPSLTPDDVKSRLIATAQPAVDHDGNIAHSVFQQGAGLVNAYEAVFSTVDGLANVGLNIDAELADVEHYGGPANQKEDGTYYIMNHEGENDGSLWDGAYTNTDAFGQAFLWSDSLGQAFLWSDALGQAFLWSDALGQAFLWSDSLGQAFLWSDSYSHDWTAGLTEIMSINSMVPQE